METPQVSKPRLRGRPKTGRALARYWIVKSVISRIEEIARERGLPRAADVLEQTFAGK